MALAPVTLADKYTLRSGRIFLSGIQALVRIPMMQRERDRAAGLATGGFISGYRGSPLGGYDTALWQASKLLAEHDVRFEPGLNEDLAATAVWGTQQVGLFPGAKVDGVFAIWYGKGPGVDRSMDVLRHANLAGSSRYGGVLAIAGDDHGAQSSTTAHQSEQILAALMMPVLNPATVQEYLDFGILGFALSRYSGCWIGFKALSETVESSATVDVDPGRVEIALPQDFEPPPDGLHIRWPKGAMDWALDQERRLHGPKMAAVRAFARANALDRTVFDTPAPRLGIMTTGKAYLDVRQAFDELGINDAAAAALGIRLYKVGLAWPIESSGARQFADGPTEILVIEEKRSFLEQQLVQLLFNTDAARRPLVVGKSDESGAPLLPSAGELTPTMVARAIMSRLRRLGAESAQFEQRLARLESLDRRIAQIPFSTMRRTPFFCSGCPHNSSTRLPDGSRAMAGIGCHSMAMFMPGRNTATLSQMGGEGANWIGQAPFTAEKHVFQNLGDGTYAHSGLTAIRAAAAAGVNITYKILHNDAVAMTGGQPVEGSLTVPQIAHQVACEGAKRVVIVSDEPEKYRAVVGLPGGADLRHRDELDAVQRELRDVSGLTVLIYDQTCAAEKRRRRKRGAYPDPDQRVFINEAVCEGCGDCSEQSSCISVRPLETELGRKRQIDQSSCNKDFSCLKGFCPSFVTVHGGTPRKLQIPDLAVGAALAELPLPHAPALDRPYGIVIAGIGGSGVMTLGALLAMAAHLEGKAATVLDFTGLSQKNGAVMSHVRLAQRSTPLHAVRVAAGGAGLLLGCDMVAAASREALTCVDGGATRAIVNSNVAPTAAFVMDPDLELDTATMQRALTTALGDAGIEFIDGTGLATALLGDAIATNLFMLGYAFQKGLVPVGLAAIERAIELNGVAVESNRRALGWGRLAAHDGPRVETLVRPLMPPQQEVPRQLDALIEHRAAFLANYQNAAYARRYRDFVAQIAIVETARTAGRSDLAQAVAKNLFKLMAYKDEYEVARLYTNGAFEEKLRRQFEGELKLEFHLAAPLFARRDPTTGAPRKRAYGPWMLKLLKLLASVRALRGTPLDVFGHTRERRQERQLIARYRDVLHELANVLDRDNHPLAVEIARLPEQMRGFGHIKARNVEKAKAREAELLAVLRGTGRNARAA
ncbi:MAG TPA: indolepyruvate ferredoxin oxidoreductase family protein [Xanthobacteraceae bacterium]